MHNKKSVIENDTDELLNALEQSEASVKSLADIQSEILPQHRSTYKFLKKNGIEIGEHRILKRYLYTLYLKESDEKKPTPRMVFNKVLGMLLNAGNSPYVSINISVNRLFEKLQSKNQRKVTRSVNSDLRVSLYLDTLLVREGTFFVKDKWIFNDFKTFYRNKKTSVRAITFEKFKTLISKYLKTTRKDSQYNTWYGVNETMYKRLNKQQGTTDGEET
jgi:hypothetical protein